MNKEAVVNEQKPQPASAFQAIRAIDYTVIFVRDMAAMRTFYEGILAFPLTRELSPGWIEYRLGGNTLALARPSRTAQDAPTPAGSASLQLAFKVSPPDVDRCADELVRQGVDLAVAAYRPAVRPSHAFLQGSRRKFAGGVRGDLSRARAHRTGSNVPPPPGDCRRPALLFIRPAAALALMC